MLQDRAVAQVTHVRQDGIQAQQDKVIEAATLADPLHMLAVVAAALAVMAAPGKEVMQAKAAWADKLELPETQLGTPAAAAAVVTVHKAAQVVEAQVVGEVAQEIILIPMVITDSFNQVTPVTELLVQAAAVEPAGTTGDFLMATAAKAVQE